MEKDHFYFDAIATAYDSDFTQSRIGQLQRTKVYQLLITHCLQESPKKIFELNCGTGHDAIQLASFGHQVFATDISEGMILESQKKSHPNVEFLRLSIQESCPYIAREKSDVIFSNFGGLNCLSPQELHHYIEDLAKVQKKGSYISWVIMPRFCAFESWYMFFKGKWKSIFRRNTDQALNVSVGQQEVPTYYHAPAFVKKKLQNSYDILQLKPIAVFIPPSYMEAFFQKHPSLLRLLSFLDKTIGSFSGLSFLSDHYIIIARKK